MTKSLQPLDVHACSENVPLNIHSGSDLRQRASASDNLEADLPTQENTSDSEDEKAWGLLLEKIHVELHSEFPRQLIVIFLCIFLLNSVSKLERYVLIAVYFLVFFFSLSFLWKNVTRRKYSFRTQAMKAIILNLSVIFSWIYFIILWIRGDMTPAIHESLGPEYAEYADYAFLVVLGVVVWGLFLISKTYQNICQFREVQRESRIRSERRIEE